MNLSHQTLASAPERYNETMRLIETSFHYLPEYKFEYDFYPLVNPINHKHNHILIKDKKVVAHIGVLIRELSKGPNSTKVALIGGIAVDEDSRGQGLFKTLFNDVINKYKDRVSLFLLWSEKANMYKKFHFHEFGGIIQTGNEDITDEDISKLGFEKAKFKTLTPKDQSNIKNLYRENQEKYLSLKRTSRDWDSISEIKSTHLYIKRSGKRIIQYFFKDKGFDLTNIIHEASFLNDEETIESFQKYKLWLPEKHRSYINASTTIFTGLLKVSNHDLLKDFFQKIFNNDLVILNITEDQVEFTFKEKSFQVSQEEFFSLTLGPNPAEEFIPYANWPLICGLDSI